MGSKHNFILVIEELAEKTITNFYAELTSFQEIANGLEQKSWFLY